MELAEQIVQQFGSCGECQWFQSVLFEDEGYYHQYLAEFKTGDERKTIVESMPFAYKALRYDYFFIIVIISKLQSFGSIGFIIGFTIYCY